jgi:hypothetical protein
MLCMNGVMQHCANKKLHFSLRLINQPPNQLTTVKPSRVIGRVNSKQLSPCFGDPFCLHHQGFFFLATQFSETSHCRPPIYMACSPGILHNFSTTETCQSVTKTVTNSTGQPFLTNWVDQLHKTKLPANHAIRRFNLNRRPQVPFPGHLHIVHKRT